MHSLLELRTVLRLATLSLCWAVSLGFGQDTTPRPQDLEPRVNTSATPEADQGADKPSVPQSQRPPSPASRALRKPRTGATTDSAGAARHGVTAGADGVTSSGAAGTGGAAVSGNSAPSSTEAGGAPSTPRVDSTQGADRGSTSSASGVATRRGAAAAPASAAGAKAHDRIELDTTQITGNRELPKVLYIVPWKRSDLGDLVGRPVNSLLDEVLAPVDRDVFRRENRYYDALKPGAQAANGSPAGAEAKP